MIQPDRTLRYFTGFTLTAAGSVMVLVNSYSRLSPVRYRQQAVTACTCEPSDSLHTISSVLDIAVLAEQNLSIPPVRMSIATGFHVQTYCVRYLAGTEVYRYVVAHVTFRYLEQTHSIGMEQRTIDIR
jgi:hypothetical protein